MYPTPPPPEREALVAQAQSRFDTLVRRCDLPLVGLAEPAPDGRDFAGVADADVESEAFELVTLVYGDAQQRDGTLVRVHIARWRQSTVAPDLRDLLEDALDEVGDDSVVDEHRAERQHLLIGDEARPATVLRVGSRFWAARCAYRRSEVTVVARDWAPEPIRLVPVPALAPFLGRGRAELAARVLLDGAGAPPAANPHRALVELSLRHNRESRERLQRGRRPRRPAGLGHSGGLWESTVSAQMHLADQSRSDANQAVTAMVNQLVRLQEDAAWFTADDRLREAAVNETLIYWTDLREAVPSQAAQEAWRQVWQTQLNPRVPVPGHDEPERPAPETFGTWLGQLENKRAAWHDAWLAWSTAAAMRPVPGRR